MPSCHSKQTLPPFSNRQEAEFAQCFLEKMLLEEAGIYTLFGSKPMTDLLIFTGTKEDISLVGLSEESLQQVTYEEDRTLEYYKAWKKVAGNLKFHKFRFFERPSPYDPLHVSCFLLNLEKAREIVEENRDLFAAKLGKEVSFDEAIQQLEEPNSSFWNTVLQDHELSGLLHGYGRENIEFFLEPFSKKCFSEENRRNVDPEHLPLPLYAVSPQDSTTEKYRQERRKIQSLYKNENFLEITLKRLTE